MNITNLKTAANIRFAAMGADGRESKHHSPIQLWLWQEYWGVEKYTSINPKINIKYLASFTDKDENINAELPTSEWELNFSEQNGITKVSISVYFESLEELQKMIEMGFKEGFTMTINELGNLLSTLNK